MRPTSNSETTKSAVRVSVGRLNGILLDPLVDEQSDLISSLLEVRLSTSISLRQHGKFGRGQERCGRVVSTVNSDDAEVMADSLRKDLIKNVY